jgi:hypothetical protein
MSCRYYAHNGMFGPLIPNPGSNQCGLIVSSHAPCQMEMDGLPPDEAKCSLVAIAREGMRLEPDLGQRDSRFHKRIVEAHRIAETRTGHDIGLECGHRVKIFGRLELTNGVAWCQQCFDANTRPKG